MNEYYVTRLGFSGPINGETGAKLVGMIIVVIGRGISGCSSTSLVCNCGRRPHAECCRVEALLRGNSGSERSHPMVEPCRLFFPHRSSLLVYPRKLSCYTQWTQHAGDNVLWIENLRFTAKKSVACGQESPTELAQNLTFGYYRYSPNSVEHMSEESEKRLSTHFEDRFL